MKEIKNLPYNFSERMVITTTQAPVTYHLLDSETGLLVGGEIVGSLVSGKHDRLMVCGPPASGKTTCLREILALVQEIAGKSSITKSLEVAMDRIERELKTPIAKWGKYGWDETTYTYIRSIERAAGGKEDILAMENVGLELEDEYNYGNGAAEKESYNPQSIIVYTNPLPSVLEVALFLRSEILKASSPEVLQRFMKDRRLTFKITYGEGDKALSRSARRQKEMQVLQKVAPPRVVQQVREKLRLRGLSLAARIGKTPQQITNEIINGPLPDGVKIDNSWERRDFQLRRLCMDERVRSLRKKDGAWVISVINVPVEDVPIYLDLSEWDDHPMITE